MIDMRRLVVMVVTVVTVAGGVAYAAGTRPPAIIPSDVTVRARVLERQLLAEQHYILHLAAVDKANGHPRWAARERAAGRRGMGAAITLLRDLASVSEENDG